MKTGARASIPPERERDSAGTEEEREGARDGEKCLRFSLRPNAPLCNPASEQTSGGEEECRQRWDYSAETSNSAGCRSF